MIVITYGELLFGVAMVLVLAIAIYLSNYVSHTPVINGQVKDEPESVSANNGQSHYEPAQSSSFQAVGEESTQNPSSNADAKKQFGDVDMAGLKSFAEKTLREQPWYSDDAVAAKTVLVEMSYYEDARLRAMAELSTADYYKWKQEHPPQEALMYAKSALDYEKSIRNQPMVKREQ